MNTGLISVIVPVYKVEKYLDICVSSIVRQTYKNLEIILVDDGSPDSCPEMCDEWAKKDSRIIVIHKENGGLSSARNAGLDIASGEYIGFIDSDDYIAEDMYEILMMNLVANNAKMACCGFRRDTNGVLGPENKSDEVKILRSKEALNRFFCEDGVSGAAWDKLYAKDVFSGIRFPVGETNEDYPLAIPLFTNAGVIVSTRKQLYFYRCTEGSITGSTWKTDAGIVLKHFYEMDAQIDEYGVGETRKSFNVFCARGSYSIALHLDLFYDRISDAAKANQKRYIALMRKHFGAYITSKHERIKDKILYILVLTRMLRPVYKICGRL